MNTRKSILYCVYVCWMGILAINMGGCSDSSDNQVITELPPPAPLQAVYELSKESSVPEGVTFDPLDRAFYVGGFGDASITRVDANGTETVFRTGDDRAALTGMKVDPQARRLWVCARSVDEIDNRVWVFDLNSREMVMEFTLAALFADASCNDLILDQSGVAYVTDSLNPNIYRLDPQTETGQVFVSDELLDDPTGFGSNGIVITEDNTALIVGKFLQGQLIRISLPDAEELSRINLDGDALVLIDGLALSGNDVYAVSDQDVSRVRLDADLENGTVTTRQQISGLSTATFAEEALYVVKSEVRNRVLGRPLDLPLKFFRIDLAEFD